MTSTRNSLSIIFTNNLSQKNNILDNDYYNDIQNIRKQYDKSYCRWPLHINVLFPFYNYSIPQLHDKLYNFITSFSPFTFYLDCFDYYEHKNSCSIFLKPSNDSNWITFNNYLLEIFPDCQKEFDRFDGKYHPHMTIGQTKTKNQAEQLISQLSLSWKWFNTKIHVNNMSILKRDDSGSMNIFYTMKFQSILESNPLNDNITNNITNNIVYKQFKNYLEDIPYFKWDNKQKKWGNIIKNIKQRNISSFSLLSYNILYDIPDKTKNINHSLRIECILLLLKYIDIDIISLQEVTPSILQLIIEQDWIRKSYYITDTINNGACTVNPYGQLILSKFPLKSLQIIEFSTNKRALFAEILINNTSTYIISMHLTSGSNNSLIEAQQSHIKRKEQLDIIYKYTNKYSNVILCGDWNCGDINDLNEMKKEYTENNIQEYSFAIDTPKDYIDIINTQRNQFQYNDLVTFDPKRNPTALKTTRHFTQIARRLDRICIKSNNYKSTSWLRIGIDPIYSNDNIILPSDHFGLLSIFSPINSTIDITSWKILHYNAFIHINSILACMSPWNPIYCYRVGSSAIGTADNTSDLDILCIGTISPNLFFIQLENMIKLSQKYIRNNNSIEFIRYVKDTIVPIIELCINGIYVDIQYSCTISLPSSNKFSFKTFTNLKINDKESELSLESILSTNIILGVLKYEKIYQRFLNLCLYIRKWAKYYKIYGSIQGYLTGHSICIMCISSLLYNKNNNNSLEDDIQEFFELYKSWDWTQPICIPLNSSKFPCKPLIISNIPEKNKIDVREPYSNTNILRSITFSTFRHIIAQINNTTCYNSDFSKTIDYNKHYETILQVSLHCYIIINIGITNKMTISEKHKWKGYCKSKITNIITKLESFYGAGYICIPQLEDNNIHFIILQKGKKSKIPLNPESIIQESFSKHKPIPYGKITIRIQ